MRWGGGGNWGPWNLEATLEKPGSCCLNPLQKDEGEGLRNLRLKSLEVSPPTFEALQSMQRHRGLQRRASGRVLLSESEEGWLGGVDWP